MKKRMLTLGIVLALVAAMIIPAAVTADTGNTDVTGGIVGATITITAPPAINLGMLAWGDNTGNSTGSVSVTANSRNPSQSNWQVSAVDQKSPNTGYMVKSGPTPLASGMLQISPDNSSWASANTTITWTGNTSGTHNIPFYVKQAINQVEAAGNYSITITFTASITLGGN
jgi:spore coat protein U-like protein